MSVAVRPPPPELEGLSASGSDHADDASFVTLHVCGRSEVHHPPNGPPITLQDLHHRAEQLLEYGRAAPEYGLVDGQGVSIASDEQAQAVAKQRDRDVHVQMSESALYDFERRVNHFRQLQWGYVCDQLSGSREVNETMKSDIGFLRSELQRLRQQMELEHLQHAREVRQLQERVQVERERESVVSEGIKKDLQNVLEQSLQQGLQSLRSELKLGLDEQMQEVHRQFQVHEATHEQLAGSVTDVRKNLTEALHREQLRMESQMQEVAQQLAEARRTFAQKASNMDTKAQELHQELRDFCERQQSTLLQHAVSAAEEKIEERLQERVGPPLQELWQVDVNSLRQEVNTLSVRAAALEGSSIAQELKVELQNFCSLEQSAFIQRATQVVDERLECRLNDRLGSLGQEHWHVDVDTLRQEIVKQADRITAMESDSKSSSDMEQWIQQLPEVVATHVGNLEERLQIGLQQERDERCKNLGEIAKQVFSNHTQVVDEQKRFATCLEESVRVTRLSSGSASSVEQLHSELQQERDKRHKDLQALRVQIEERSAKAEGHTSTLEVMQLQIEKLRKDLASHSHSLNVEDFLPQLGTGLGSSNMEQSLGTRYVARGAIPGAICSPLSSPRMK